EARQRNQMMIWNQIQTLPSEKLNGWLSEPISPNMRGWLSLAKIVHQANKNPNQFEVNFLGVEETELAILINFLQIDWDFY
ncbi:hypothetical protein LI003_23380, partial [Bacteroides caccae]|uniref:hypothetical protein n=1 Tax=Bacteroides caccae TaxID=47678 RepID=UPI001D078D80